MFALSALALLFFGLARRSPHPSFTTLYQFRHLLLLSAAPLAVLAVMLSEPIAAGLLLAATVVWFLEFGGQFRPVKVSAKGAREGDLFMVNLNAGDHRSDPVKIVDYLVESDCDVACLQEVHADHLRIFEEQLGEQYPHRRYEGTGIGGLATLSKHPIEATETLQFGGCLPHLMTTVVINERPLRVVNVHPFVSVAFLGEKSPAFDDFQQLANLVQDGRPTVIMGDFNTTDQSNAYHVLQDAGLTDSFKAARGTFGATFPVPMRYLFVPCPPVLRIDFSWVTSHLHPVGSRVGRDASSDHLPLETALAWSTPSADLAVEADKVQGTQEIHEPVAPMPSAPSESEKVAASKGEGPISRTSPIDGTAA